MNKNYKLSNGQFFHFHECEDGFDYTVYDRNGLLIDGGILEYDLRFSSNEEKVLKALATFTEIPQLLGDDKVEIDESIIEEFECTFKM